MTPEPGSSVASHAVLRERLDRLLPRPMVFLAFLFLLVMAGITHRLHSHVSFLELEVILGGLWLLLPVFVVEGLVRIWLHDGAVSLGRRLGFFLLTCLAPPVRLCARGYSDPQLLWIPFLGWQHADRELRRRLERFFSVPMIVIALMVLPFLGLEYLWSEQVEEHFGLKLFLDIGTAVIWTAFAIEFIVMAAVADRKLKYCVQHWTDLAVVVLPLIDFLPFLRLLRLGRILQLQQLSRMGRVYRLRGLFMKLWRALLVLEMLQRLAGNTPQKRLQRLRELLAAKEEELADLRREIEELAKQPPGTP